MNCFEKKKVNSFFFSFIVGIRINTLQIFNLAYFFVTATTTMAILKVCFLQFQTFLGLHDFLDHAFGHVFFPGQTVNGFDHLGISFPLVL